MVKTFDANENTGEFYREVNVINVSPNVKFGVVGESNLTSVMSMRPNTLSFTKKYLDKVKTSIMLKKRHMYLCAIGHKKSKKTIVKTRLCNIQEETFP